MVIAHPRLASIRDASSNILNALGKGIIKPFDCQNKQSEKLFLINKVENIFGQLTCFFYSSRRTPNLLNRFFIEHNRRIN